MTRAVEKAANFGILGGIFGLLIDGLAQYSNLKQEGLANSLGDFWSNYDTDKALKSAAIGSLIGTGVGVGSHLIDKRNQEIENAEPFNQNRFLGNVLKENQIDRNSQNFIEDQEWVREIKEFCIDTLGHLMIDKPLDAGSMVKRVAVANSDYDIALAFTEKSANLGNLHDMVYEELQDFENEGFTVRKQNRSVGLIKERNDGSVLKIDVLPAKDRGGKYAQTGDLSIWDSRNQTHLKTNIDIHNNELKREPQIRDAIKLAKIYVKANDLPISSSTVSNLVRTGMQREGFNSSKAANIKSALSHIAKNMHRVNLKDPANGNNNLMANMTEKDRAKVQNTIWNDLECVEANPRELKKMFNK